MYKYIVFFIAALLFFSGCGQQPTKTTITHSTILKEAEGKNFGIFYIDSDKYYWIDKDQEIKNKMKKFLEISNYDIIKINSNYCEGFLVSVEIYYNKPFRGMQKDAPLN